MELNKIIIISDTHMRLSKSCYRAICGNYELSQIYKSKYFNSQQDQNNFQLAKSKIQNELPDLIIHAGDIGDQNIINTLESLSKVIAVQGNCDWESYITNNGPTNKYECIDFQGIKIAVTHTPYDLESFSEKQDFNLLIHGHTHESYIDQQDDNKVWICPGSATMGRYGSPNSIAAVYISDNKIMSADLIKV